MSSYRDLAKKEHLADMRSNALRARALTLPDYPCGNLEFRTMLAVSALRNAINYRDMAREMGQFKKQTEPVYFHFDEEMPTREGFEKCIDLAGNVWEREVTK